MLGAAAATERPRWRSIRCLPNVAACAELPRAQVTTNCGGLRLSRASNSFSGAARQWAWRSTASGASRNSTAMPTLMSLIASKLPRSLRPSLTRQPIRRRPAPAAARRPAHRLPAAPASAWSYPKAIVRYRAPARPRARCARRRTPPAAPPRHRCGRGQPHELVGDRIAGMLDHGRRQRGEIARRRVRRPAHDRMRVGLELARQLAQEIGPRDALVMRPQDPAQRLAAEPGAAALIRDRHAPAADP